MAKFMYIYNGPATDMSAMTEEDTKVMMDGWTAWMGRIGTALVDIGSPLGAGVSVVDDGSKGTPLEISGYSIIEAEDLAAAEKLADGHPFLSAGTGEFSIEILQIFPAPF